MDELIHASTPSESVENQLEVPGDAVNEVAAAAAAPEESGAPALLGLLPRKHLSRGRISLRSLFPPALSSGVSCARE